MSRAWILTSVLVTSACADLPEVTPGMCGNRAVESDEDCEADQDGLTCVQCRFVCSPQEAAPACPDGWGCSTAGTCAHGASTFVATAPVSARFPGAMVTANLVNETADELVLTDVVDAGFTRVSGSGRTLVFDEIQGVGTDVITAGDLTGDAYDELVRTIAQGAGRTALFAQRGQVDDALAIVPALSPLGDSPETVKPRFGFLSDDEKTAIVAWKDGTTVSARIGRYVGNAVNVTGGDLLPVVMGAVVPPPIAEGSTQQAITAADGGSIVFVVGLARPGEPGESILARQLTFSLGAIVDVRVADIDLDGQPDIVVATSDSVYRYTGNFLMNHTWTRLGPVVDDLRGSECVEGPGAVPLASADLDGDGSTDYVTRFGVMRGDGPSSCLEHRLGDSALTHAAIIDVDNDTHLDIATAVAGARALTFLRAYRGDFVLDVIRTTDPVVDLLGADLDANDYKDLVIATSVSGRDQTRIAFLRGSNLGFEDDPTPVVEIPTVLAILAVPRAQSDELAVAGLVNGSLYGARIGIATASSIAFSQVLIAGGKVTGLAIGDAHGDGTADDLYAIVQRPGMPDELQLLGDQRGYLTTIDSMPFVEGGELSGPLQLLDLNGDGIDEAVMARGDTVSRWDPVGAWTSLVVPASAQRAVVRGSTDCLAFSDAAGLSLLCGSEATQIGDEAALAMIGVEVDADPDQELAVVFADRVALYDLTEQRWITEFAVDLAGPLAQLAAADLDGDGVADLAVASAAPTSSDGTLQILWGVTARGSL